MSPDGLPQFGTVTGRGRQSPRKIPTQLLAYGASSRPARGRVTMETVKQVAVGLLLESHRLTIPPCLLDVLKSPELDEFLSVLLLYLSCFLEQKALQSKPRPLMVEHRGSRVEEEAMVKVELARNKMAACYSTLLLGLSSPQHHHMACGRSLVSATHRDRHLYECLYSLFCFVPWVAFGRRDLGVIRRELSRLLRSDAFSPDDEDGGGGGGGGGGEEAEAEAEAVATRRRRRRRPPLKISMCQSSPLMSSFLPLPQEKSPHLFLRTAAGGSGGPPGTGGLPGPGPLCDTRALLEELEQQLASGSFGILGKPMRELSRCSLMPLGARRGETEERGEEEEEEEEEKEEEEEEGGGGGGDVIGVQGSKASMASAGRSRAHTGISRATTEAPLSDTE